MAAVILHLSSFLILFATLSITLGVVHAEDSKVYIAYMGARPENEYLPLAHHESILEQVLENSVPSKSLVRSYGKNINGFAARLTNSEREKLAGMKGIISVFPCMNMKLHTTRSWDFIGFRKNVKRIPKIESDVIVGVLDTGITPNSDSFTDEGFGPPPKKWKGTCSGGKDFTCNNKLIGARFYSYQTSAIDTEGHGTHTASTAAGNDVKNASFYGLGNGNARGAVPSARVAAYKVCGEDGCSNEDILAAFDDAISDGVDIISISLGDNSANDFFSDVVAIGAFHAIQKGILTVQSAGNSGPRLTSVVSVAPWLFTVAASNIDRRFVDKVILGDGKTLVGNGINGFDMKGRMFPLIYLSDCGSMSPWINITLAKGKIVYCGFDSNGARSFHAMAAGALLSGDMVLSDFSYVYPLPASSLNFTAGKRVKSYISSTKNPKATILKSESLIDSRAPMVVSFSSRGPNTITPAILKPDITAPGVDILAAWSPLASPSSVTGDTRSVTYNIISGTSMACPHVTGAAAYVKSFHPHWSPSAIKSALMTTAFPLNITKNPDAEFAYGAGQIDPVKAVNPGLVYETVEGDYINMLCSKYTKEDVGLITGKNTSCPKESQGSEKDLNYPTMTSDDISATFTRTVTNVGAANSNYTATITSPQDLKVTVIPKLLSFKSLNEKKSFSVTISSKKKTTEISSASLVWSDGIHTVRSPIVLYSNTNGK